MTPNDLAGDRLAQPASRVAGVVLAAGTSSRLGTPKQLVALDGRPALEHTLSAARQSRLAPLLIVLGAHADEVSASVDLVGFVVVRNDRHAEGQSTSIRAAVEQLPADVDAVVFLLGDQPEVDPAVIEELVIQFDATESWIVQPRYADGPGNPVLIARPLFGELRALTGDVGARPLLQRHADRVLLVDVRPRCRPGDIDTWDDVAAMRARFQHRRERSGA